MERATVEVQHRPWESPRACEATEASQQKQDGAVQ